MPMVPYKTGRVGQTGVLMEPHKTGQNTKCRPSKKHAVSHRSVHVVQKGTLNVVGRLRFNKPKTFRHRTDTGCGQLHGGLVYKPGRSQESLSKYTEINGRLYCTESVYSRRLDVLTSTF